MAYTKSTDLNDIQNDVLTSDLTSNTKISKINSLRTTAKTIVKAINELNGLLGAAVDQAQTATQNAQEANAAVETTKTEIQQTIQNVVKEVVVQKMTEDISGGIQNDEFACVDNQTKFTLSKQPLDKNNLLFYVNGVKYLRSDWSFNEAANEIVWVNTSPSTKGFVIGKNDMVSIVYMVK